AVEMFANAADIQLEAVQYKGAPPIIPDLLTGRVGMSILAASNVTGHVREGKLRALATASDERNPDTPDIPTMIESGYPDVEALSWFCFNAPTGTPPDRIKKLSDAMEKALTKPEVQKQLKSADTRIAFMDPVESGTYLENEKRRWSAVAESL